MYKFIGEEIGTRKQVIGYYVMKLYCRHTIICYESFKHDKFGYGLEEMEYEVTKESVRPYYEDKTNVE